jgi:hypothetical protein
MRDGCAAAVHYAGVERTKRATMRAGEFYATRPPLPDGNRLCWPCALMWTRLCTAILVNFDFAHTFVSSFRYGSGDTRHGVAIGKTEKVQVRENVDGRFGADLRRPGYHAVTCAQTL